MTTTTERPADPRLPAALDLFRFLAAAQRLQATPVRTLDAYRRDEQRVVWLHDVPDHDAVASAVGADPDPSQPFLVVDRVPAVDPPEPPSRVQRWVTGDWRDPRSRVQVRELLDEPPAVGGDAGSSGDGGSSGDEPGEGPAGSLRLDDHPRVRAAVDEWLTRWGQWAETERRDRPVRQLYADLHHVYTRATGQSEEYEALLCVGCLSWAPPDQDPVQRHLVSARLSPGLDPVSGHVALTLDPAAGGLDVELDMLGPGTLVRGSDLDRAREGLEGHDGHPLSASGMEQPLRALVHSLHASSTYSADAAPPPVSAEARVTFAPAVVLRRRSRQDVADVYDRIVQQLAGSRVVPDGLAPLVDADHVPHPAPVGGEAGLASPTGGESGAAFRVDGELFLPLPVNDRQRRIVELVDRQPHVLVQGPPGTGKTHTAAVLVSHLLAQGQRVLVTAQTDRALEEVRDKLPDPVKPLAVSVVGTSREDMTTLTTAVETIAARAADHDPDEADETVTAARERLVELGRRRADTYAQLARAREADVQPLQLGPYEGTRGAIADRLRDEAGERGWLDAGADPGALDDDPPVDDGAFDEWLRATREPDGPDDVAASEARLVDVAALPTTERFAELVAGEAVAADSGRLVAARRHAAFARAGDLDRDDRRRLVRALRDVHDAARALSGQLEPWVTFAVRDVTTGRAAAWRDRGRVAAELLRRTEEHVARVPLVFDVVAAEQVRDATARMAAAVAATMADGEALRTDAAGRPKLGLRSPRVLKESAMLFDAVRVNGLPPTTRADLDGYVAWCEATRNLDALDRTWPASVDVPRDGTVGERLQWHATEIGVLEQVLALADRIDETADLLDAMRLPPPAWHDVRAVAEYADAVEAVDAADAVQAWASPLDEAGRLAGTAAAVPGASPAVAAIEAAVAARDVPAYAAALQRVAHLASVAARTRRDQRLVETLQAAAPGLADAVRGPRPAVAVRSPLSAAWRWAGARRRLADTSMTDVNDLQDRLNRLDDEIRHVVQQIAATRAWSAAVSPTRLTGRSHADLQQYAQLVRRHGKGTGRYAARRAAEIRDAMARCRPAVPVWIMPLYRIAQQFQVEPDMFDVVIVDEASQAGAEATYLQYLAPRMVVIGDDKQVSPSAVGTELQQLVDLAARHIPDDRYRATWQDPKVSLFDSARMRFGDRVVLTEHRRCVPEIIGFSNQVAYEPEGVRLVPVRQYGTDRLDPIQTVHVPDGRIEGSAATRVNRAEAEAVVAQVEKCIADPRYDGKTIGVISLLGTSQAERIEKMLLDRVPPDEWAARDLRVGDSVAFQGSERDVVVLSMVAAPNRRLVAATRDETVQRYNVAASRARDQMWLVHSVTLDDLGNPDDLRYQLLDYCLDAARRGRVETVDVLADPVPEDRLVDPFRSLVEQRVANRLIERGYAVIPRHRAMGYPIDLVVVGGQRKLAVECDGDTWRGAEQYRADLQRQRELQRCGWPFFRLRESDVILDEDRALAGLWDLLESLGIRPAE